jgi:hypothetical protein
VEELVEQVAVGAVDFYSVEAGLPGILRALVELGSMTCLISSRVRAWGVSNSFLGRRRVTGRGRGWRWERRASGR